MFLFSKSGVRSFTLVEALVSAVLLGVGVVGLMSAATVGQRNSYRSEQRTVAVCLAQEKMAEVEAAGPHLWSLGQPMKGTESRDGVAYDWALKIDRLSAGELFDVRVTVDWAGAAGTGSVGLETWLNDYPARFVNASERKKPNQSETSGNPRQR
jgi:Tfp pilus assembly protein PilV